MRFAAVAKWAEQLGAETGCSNTVERKLIEFTEGNKEGLVRIAKSTLSDVLGVAYEDPE